MSESPDEAFGFSWGIARAGVRVRRPYVLWRCAFWRYVLWRCVLWRRVSWRYVLGLWRWPRPDAP
jgi:hypothetical protein